MAHMRSLGLLHLALIALMFFPGCKRPAPPPSPTVSSIAVVDDRPTLYFGAISRYNPVLMYRTYQPIMDYLSAETPYRFELKLGKTYEDAVRFLREGRVDICSLGGLTYLEAHAEFGALPLVKPLNSEGQPHYHSLFVVPQDSPLQTLADLEGHSLALASPRSTSGNLIPRDELARVGLRTEDLSRCENLPHHDMVAKAVLAGQFDAGALKDIVGRAFQTKGLRFLHESNPIPSVPLVARADLDESVKTNIVNALLKLDARKSADQARLADWDEEFRYGFTRATTADYESLRSLEGAPTKCAKSCHQNDDF